ncbi:flavodoxin [Breznakibacter xylanolyticus]|uniref:Flavodoxin n=2 Tax=Breznakibacter xylanolyticus TaxID=990 RepID=A0A2W7PQN9_9BACT|nr:flavodoxin [Breznakibacter xylanolyticus]
MAILIPFGLKMQAQNNTSGNKILVVYFSHTKNTKEIATQIQQLTGADLFELVPSRDYTTDYQALIEQAKKEINADYKPPLKNNLQGIDQYDVIFVGSPNWWNTFAPPVATFLTSHDFSGKTIVPFITHEGSRMGRSEADMKKLCPKATFLKGLPIRGSSVKEAKPLVERWLREIGVMK